MREYGNGIIINISSMSGFIGIPATSVYVSTKFTLEGFSEYISYELHPYRIKVILIEPGVIRTNFVPNTKFPNSNDNKLQQILLKEELKDNYSNNDIKQENSLSYYSNTVDAFLSLYYAAMKNAPLPKEVATVILHAIKNASNSSENLFRYTVGDD